MLVVVGRTTVHSVLIRQFHSMDVPRISSMSAFSHFDEFGISEQKRISLVLLLFFRFPTPAPFLLRFLSFSSSSSSMRQANNIDDDATRISRHVPSSGNRSIHFPVQWIDRPDANQASTAGVETLGKPTCTTCKGQSKTGRWPPRPPPLSFLTPHEKCITFCATRNSINVVPCSISHHAPIISNSRIGVACDS